MSVDYFEVLLYILIFLVIFSVNVFNLFLALYEISRYDTVASGIKKNWIFSNYKLDPKQMKTITLYAALTRLGCHWKTDAYTQKNYDAQN